MLLLIMMTIKHDPCILSCFLDYENNFIKGNSVYDYDYDYEKIRKVTKMFKLV